jgi:hypothetical protein
VYVTILHNGQCAAELHLGCRRWCITIGQFAAFS